MALQPSGLAPQITFICDRSVWPLKLQGGGIWSKHFDFNSAIWREGFVLGKHWVAALGAASKEAAAYFLSTPGWHWIWVAPFPKEKTEELSLIFFLVKVHVRGSHFHFKVIKIFSVTELNRQTSFI